MGSIEKSNILNEEEVGSSTTVNIPIYNVRQEMEKNSTIRKNGTIFKNMINANTTTTTTTTTTTNNNNNNNYNNYNYNNNYNNYNKSNNYNYNNNSNNNNYNYNNNNNINNNNNYNYNNNNNINNNNTMTPINYQFSSPYSDPSQNIDAYYQHMLLNKYNEEENTKELIDQIDNEVDLSNVTLSNENGNNAIKRKEVIKGNYDPRERDRITTIDDDKRSLSSSPSSSPSSSSCCCGCCCGCCCKCCGVTIGMVISLFIVCILITLGFFYFPRIPTITVADVEIMDMPNILTTLKSYSNYYREVQQLFPNQNIDLTFDFNVTFSLHSHNLYNNTFRDAEMEVNH
ncbi:hypothetical protein PIROE2DRAFT_2809 [Piromyces sp. E2]|nr:hypothetical protein PIROE2DRAFT_2809 [Piromyces sp. E2]|eukprot:OUM69307.1 hypothetical protein PIROE2DRAFT_2809 [Piromyces sp. E2]